MLPGTKLKKKRERERIKTRTKWLSNKIKDHDSNLLDYLKINGKNKPNIIRIRRERKYKAFASFVFSTNKDRKGEEKDFIIFNQKIKNYFNFE